MTTWLEVIEGIPNHGLVYFVSWDMYLCLSFIIWVYLMFYFLGFG